MYQPNQIKNRLRQGRGDAIKFIQAIVGQESQSSQHYTQRIPELKHRQGLKTPGWPIENPSEEGLAACLSRPPVYCLAIGWKPMTAKTPTSDQDHPGLLRIVRSASIMMALM
jgi:hypothetical protein